MKKLLLCLMGILMTFPTFAEDSKDYFTYTYEGKELEYKIINSTENICEVSGLNKYSKTRAVKGEVVVPDYAVFDNKVYKVTAVGSEAFYYNWSVTSIKLGNSIRSIDSKAFAECNKLTSIMLGDSVTSIGEKAFFKTKIDSISIPNSVTTIENEAFAKTNLLSLTIPSSVTSIGSEAFLGIKKLRSVVIEGILDNVGSSPFELCSDLDGIWFPNEEIADANKKFYPKLQYALGGLKKYDIKIGQPKPVGEIIAEEKEKNEKAKKEAEALKAQQKTPAKLPFALEKEYGKMYWQDAPTGGRNLINKTGKVILNSKKYDKIYFEWPCIIVKKNGKFGAVSYTGKVIVTPIYDKYEGNGREGRMCFTNMTPNGFKSFCIAKTGAVLASKAFTHSQTYSATAWLKDWFGIINAF